MKNRIERIVSGIVVYAPDYSVPGVREEVERECREAEWSEIERISSSEMLYRMWRANRG